MPRYVHPNTNEMRPEQWGYGFIFRDLVGKDAETHAHYARNAIACGHKETCAKVTTPVNWPTLFGRPGCTCGKGEPKWATDQAEARQA